MSILINFKICDNSDECEGPKLCPVKALTWDNKKKTLKIDNTKCISCTRCARSCPVGAIHVARTEAEYKKIKKEIDKDPRKISDLFVDKYGAQILDTSTIIKNDKVFKTKITKTNKLIICEFFDPSMAQCLIRSIPIKELFKHIDMLFYKVDVSNMKDLMNIYDVKKIPSLLFFKNEKLIGKIQGFYDIDHKKDLQDKIQKMLKKCI